MVIFLSKKNSFDFFSVLWEASDKAYLNSLALFEFYSSGGFCENKDAFDCFPILRDFSLKLNSEFFTTVDREDIFALSCLTGKLCRDLLLSLSKLKSVGYFNVNDSLSEILRILPEGVKIISDILGEFSLFPKCKKLFVYRECVQNLLTKEKSLLCDALKSLNGKSNFDVITYDLIISAHGIFEDLGRISEYSIYTLIKNT